MDTSDPRFALVLRPLRRRPRRYLAGLPRPEEGCPAPAAPAAPLPLLRRVLSGLRALPDAAPPTPPAVPVAGWKCRVAGCLWESVNPMEHPCPFPPSSVAGPGTAVLAALTRRLLERDPSLGAPPEEREPSPDVVATREIPVVRGGAR